MVTYSTASNTKSSLSGPNGHNQIRTALSTNIIIKIGPNAVGAVQKLSVSEQRPLRMIDEVGTDGHIDGAPTASTNITGDCTRIRFDRMKIAEAFSRSFVHVHAQRFPFDIVIIDNWLGDGNSSIITTIHDVLIESIGYSYDASNYIISDDMRWQAQRISSTIANGPSATGGYLGLSNLALDSIEREADIGLRGSLESSLISSFLPF